MDLEHAMGKILWRVVQETTGCCSKIGEEGFGGEGRE